MNSTQEIRQRLREQLEHDLYEIEERLERETQFFDELSLKARLAQQIYEEANEPEEMDVWEFELQVIESQKRQARQELGFLREDLNKQRRILSLLVKTSF